MTRTLAKPSYEQVMAAVHRLCRAEWREAVAAEHADGDGYVAAANVTAARLAAVEDLVRRATGGGL